jgi:hypothetical protein
MVCLLLDGHAHLGRDDPGMSALETVMVTARPLLAMAGILLVETHHHDEQLRGRGQYVNKR